jgi:hypothetical protein
LETPWGYFICQQKQGSTRAVICDNGEGNYPGNALNNEQRRLHAARLGGIKERGQ